MKFFRITALVYILILFSSCQSKNTSGNTPKIHKNQKKPVEIAQKIQGKNIAYRGKAKSIHIFVALCDNKYQGIVPVPSRLGNGQKPETNLYWGAAYGVKTYFKRSKEWKLLQTRHPGDTILERLIFKHRNKDYYLIADAYNGKYIRQTTVDLLKSLSGQYKDTLQVHHDTIGIYGNARLIAYTGHDGLMDFDLPHSYKNADGQTRDAVILACISKDYFYDYLHEAGARPLLWTTGLMAPEAYTLHDAVSAYVQEKPASEIRLKAAQAYNKYQKCGLRAAKNLLVTGW